MKAPIEDRLRASLKFGANTGDRHEQEVCGNQMREAADELMRLREELRESRAEGASYRETLEGIANADWRKWDSGMNNPEDFVAWAQSRARHTLNPEPTPHERIWTGPGELERSGYIEPTPKA